MATGTLRQQQSEVSVGTWVIPGLGAGIVFAMWAMVVGIFTSTLWAPPQGIAQSVGIGTAGHDFQAVPFVLGMMAHMMDSLILGAIFVAIVRSLRVRGAGVLAATGMIYGLVVYVAMYWIVLRGMLTSTSGSFLGANPEWSWIIAHVMFGVVLGLLVSVFERRDARL